MARKFVRVSNQIYKVTSSPITGTAYPWTFACWLQVTNPQIGENQTFFGVDGSGASGFGDAIGISINNTNGQLGAFTGDQTGSYDNASAGPAPISANTWYPCVWVGTNTTSRDFYVNNSATSGHTSVNQTFGNTFNETTIGRYDPGASQYVDGNIAHCAIWNAALAAGEVDAFCSGFPPYMIRPGSLVGYWPLWGITTTEPDISGFARNMSPTNGPTAANDAPLTLFTPVMQSAFFIPDAISLMPKRMMWM